MPTLSCGSYALDKRGAEEGRDLFARGASYLTYLTVNSYHSSDSG